VTLVVIGKVRLHPVGRPRRRTRTGTGRC
jgi:hypothetical protein